MYSNQFDELGAFRETGALLFFPEGRIIRDFQLSGEILE